VAEQVDVCPVLMDVGDAVTLTAVMVKLAAVIAMLADPETLV
jgi:hypothetical protein